MDTVKIIEIGVSVVAFALCLAGYIHTKSYINTEKLAADAGRNSEYLKYKKRKKLFFVGLVISVWLFTGVIITVLSGKVSGMNIEFSMFSERINIFGISLAQTTVTSALIVLGISLLCILFRALAFPKFKDRPTGLQNVIELCVESVDKMTASAVGAKPAGFLAPYMFSLALFLVASAALELFGIRAPSSDLTVTFSLGILTFAFLNYYGFKTLGFAGRMKAMGGPVAPMRVIMIPLKMVSDIAVPVSLACRLFGNMLGGMIVMDLLKGALGGYASGIPAIAGLYFNLFHPLIQAYIFITLSLTFIEEAMETTEPKKDKNKKADSSSAENAPLSASGAAAT